jgi:hypothetical protein
MKSNHDVLWSAAVVVVCIVAYGAIAIWRILGPVFS